jgi:hypothetical protein
MNKKYSENESWSLSNKQRKKGKETRGGMNYLFYAFLSRKQHNWHALLKTVETVINKPFGAFNVLSPIVAKEQVQQKLYLS